MSRYKLYERWHQLTIVKQKHFKRDNKPSDRGSIFGPKERALATPPPPPHCRQPPQLKVLTSWRYYRWKCFFAYVVVVVFFNFCALDWRKMSQYTQIKLISWKRWWTWAIWAIYSSLQAISKERVVITEHETTGWQKRYWAIHSLKILEFF